MASKAVVGGVLVTVQVLNTAVGGTAAVARRYLLPETVVVGAEVVSVVVLDVAEMHPIANVGPMALVLELLSVLLLLLLLVALMVALIALSLVLTPVLL